MRVIAHQQIKNSLDTEAFGMAGDATDSISADRGHSFEFQRLLSLHPSKV